MEAETSRALSYLNRPGWLTFAAVVMFAVGCLRVITAIYDFANSARINNLTGGAFGGHVFLWGIWDLVIAVVALYGGYSLLGGHAFGRVIGYIWAILVIVESLLLISSAPWFGFAALVLAVLVIYALSTTSGWNEPT
jgi:hypothetical protein